MTYTRSTTALLIAALALAGCGGNSGSSTSSAAPGATAAATAQATIGVATNAPATGGVASTLPIYPGATKSPYVSMQTTKACGHTMVANLYQVKASMASIVAWYAGKMPGSTQMASGMDLGHGMSSKHVDVMAADGSQSAVVVENVYPAAIAARAPAGTMFVLSSYEPSLSADEIAMYGKIENGDKAAVAQMKAKCPDFKFGAH